MPADYNSIVDVLTLLHDNSTAVTASGVGLASAANGGGALVIDLGSDATIQDLLDAEMYGDMVVDVSSITTGVGDESYTLVLEAGEDSGFAVSEEVAVLRLGHSSLLVGSVSSDAGRYVVSFGNKRNDRTYRYLRLSFALAGAAPSLTFAARLTKRRHM